VASEPNADFKRECNMVKCPFCSFANEDGALFCEQCKSDISNVAPVPAAPKVASAARKPGISIIRCPNAACGKKIQLPDNAAGKQLRCPICRKPFQIPAPATTVASEKEAIGKLNFIQRLAFFGLRAALGYSDSAPKEEKASTSVPFDAYTGAEPFIFVSYCHRDRTVVYPEIERLHKLGFRIWYDEGIPPGMKWAEAIQEALSRSAFFVVFVSRHAMSSENVRNEINYALRRKKPFLAIHIEETELVKGMALQMEARQAIVRSEIDHSLYTRRVDENLPATLRG
jgi:TIR domain